jgi:hypothetical protein
LLAARGGFASDEIVVPANPLADSSANAARTEDAPPAQKPSVAMDGEGRFIVAWSDEVRGVTRTRAQVFDANGKPLAAACTLEEGSKDPSASSAAACADGFVVAWSRGNTAVYLRRVSASGAPSGDAVRVSTEDDVGAPSIVALDKKRPSDPERFVVAWDVLVPKLGRRLRARFIGADLVPERREFSFDTMQGGFDWDPHLAPAQNGGFAMSWTSGEDRMRDVFARVFDAEGKPASRPFAISVHANEQDFSNVTRLKDGSFAVAWEDDISFWDFVYVRRISADLKSIGPMLTLCERAKSFSHMHVGPRVTTVSTGLAAVWGDTRRSQGFDVYWKVLGPAFDSRSARGAKR